MNIIVALLVGFFLLTAASECYSTDHFEKIRNSLSHAGCVYLKFLSIIESDIFDRRDTVAGEVIIAADGRYLVNLGGDQYLYDLEYLFSYSEENNQVTIEHIKPQDAIGDEVLFITRLDKLYKTYTITPGQCYRLVKRTHQEASVPDSMIITLRIDTLLIEQIEYYDVNEELNRIRFLEQKIDTTCDDSAFVPAYPDSVESIRLD